MARIVECWFDYSSPFAYLGVARVEAVAAEAGGAVTFRPFLLGALFKELGTPIVPIAAYPEPKARQLRMDLYRHADVHGVPFTFNPHFPLRTVDALRLTLLADAAPALVHRVMRATWVDGEDPADRGVLRRCVEDAGVDVALLDRLDEPAVKTALRDATGRARSLGVPGAPCFAVGDHLYWGQDRLDFVRRALDGRPPREGP